jgi:hypothetical protein
MEAALAAEAGCMFIPESPMPANWMETMCERLRMARHFISIGWLFFSLFSF